MLSTSRSNEIFTILGTNSTLLPYLGNGIECHLVMSELNKPIREHWFEWIPEYKKVLEKSKVKIKIRLFDATVTEFLINCAPYFKFFLFEVFISNKEELEEFLNCFSQ